MLNHLLLIALLTISIASQEISNDPIDCFRMKDSSFGHFSTCSATKPLPLKAQTTFTLDKDFTWGLFAYDVALYDGVQKKTTSLSKCIQGSPGVGNKTAGSNLTLATTCNTLPRELKQYDMIRYEVHFPNTEWLVWAVPIPGYTTYEDIEKIMSQQQQQFMTLQMSFNEISPQTSEQMTEIIQNMKTKKNIKSIRSE